MLVNRRVRRSLMLRYSLPIILAGQGWATLVFVLYATLDLQFLRVPFLPIATIGTAVAFYVGFKNNSAYERFWEARKLWGAIVNASRTWGTHVMALIEPGDTSPQMYATRHDLIYRQIAWANALRLQLRRTFRFSQKNRGMASKRLRRHAEHIRNDWDAELTPFLSAEEFASISVLANPATHLLITQAKRITQLFQEDKIHIRHHVAMIETVNELHALQGHCERIKNTPFPRQYAEHGRIFTRVFVLLVPFGMLDVFARYMHVATTVEGTVASIIPMVLASSLITWVFHVMESMGDFSEDPFERGMNDVPMNAVCRAIEIDLRQMLGETDLPDQEQPADGILY